MCGIAGIINFQSTINNHQDIVNKFHNDLKHRGPDSKGYYFSSSSNALLCQTRLSIIDTSDNANQPIESYDKRFNIISNGSVNSALPLLSVQSALNMAECCPA